MDIMDAPFLLKRALPVVLLAIFWCWETWRPFFGQREGRLKHAARNLAIALINTGVLALAFGALTGFVAAWTHENKFGLLNVVPLAEPMRFVVALAMLDAWMYVWHRANHAIPLLWHFHRMHHSDRQMDVTTATRFHLGEQISSSILRLGLIPLLGIEIWNLAVYDAMVLVVVMFHHADISLGRWDRWLRWLIVTPNMHKVHHSDQRPETNSNYSTVLSVWDRFARTFRMRTDPKTIVFGLEEFTDPESRSWWGLWKTPFVTVKRGENANREGEIAAEA